MKDLKFNPEIPAIMHIDLNSCFATIEQQANPFLRGKPIAVAAYTTPNGCILAASIEAKRLGLKTGMRVQDGKYLCPDLVVLSPDPWKYRNIHLSLRKLLSKYTPDIVPKSIDEFVLDFREFCSLFPTRSMQDIAKEIKLSIKEEVGEWLTVSIGIASNRFLAKLASNLHKPDGLDEINNKNFVKIYSGLKLVDLPYIKMGNSIRLNSVGIYTPADFYNAPLWKLRAAFKSVNGYYWYLRLRGWEIDDFNSSRKTYGNSFALPGKLTDRKDIFPILSKLVAKVSTRLRSAGFKTRGIHLAVSYRNGDFSHKGVSFERAVFDMRDIYEISCRIFHNFPYKAPIREIFISCFNLIKSDSLQLELFEDVIKRKDLVTSIDKINKRWGDFVVTSGRMLGTEKLVPDRISFGGIKELEEFTFR